MRSLSGLGISLTLVFGCLFLALLAEIYYLLCWKKRVAHCDRDDERTSPARELASHLFCWRKPSSLTSAVLIPRGICSTRSSRAAAGGGDSGGGAADDSMAKGDSIEVELMRLHNLCGPPRLLYTIKEETKEDMESEDEKPAADRGPIGDVVLTLDGGGGATPFETPLSSPRLFSPPDTPLRRYGQHGFNPLFESCKDDEEAAAARWIRASPPPKFKFLRDAEEKLHRKTLMMEEEALKAQKNAVKEEEEAATASAAGLPASINRPPLALLGGEETRFVAIDIGKNQVGRPTNPSQVIPISVQ